MSLRGIACIVTWPSTITGQLARLAQQLTETPRNPQAPFAAQEAVLPSEEIGVAVRPDVGEAGAQAPG